MKWDVRLVSGIFVGLILGLHYYSILSAYMPILVVITLVMLLKLIKV